MTDAELAEVRTWVGDTPTDAELQAMYDSLGSVAEVVRAVLRRRLTDLISQPASLTIPGDISVSRGANIKALQDRIAEVDAYYGVGGALARVIPPPERRAR